jgi:hypothetical protein
VPIPCGMAQRPCIDTVQGWVDGVQRPRPPRPPRGVPPVVRIGVGGTYGGHPLHTHIDIDTERERRSAVSLAGGRQLDVTS